MTLMKLILSILERARSKLRVTHSNNLIRSDLNIEIENLDSKSNQYLSAPESLIIQQQSSSSLSKWLCSTPASIDRSISSSRSNKIRRTNSFKQHRNDSINSKTLSIDELHRNNKQSHYIRRRHPSHSPVVGSTRYHPKLSNSTTKSTHFDRLSSTVVNYSENKKNDPYQNNRKQIERSTLLALSCHSGGVDSGYSEENFPIRSYKRLLHTRCPYCYCERSLSFNNNRKKLRNNSSTESFPSDIITTKENQNSSYIDCCNREKLLFSQSYPHIKPIPRTNFHSKQQITRTLADKRQRNLSCDASLWTRIQTPKPNNLTSSSVFSKSNHLSLQRGFTTIDMQHCRPSKNTQKRNSSVFGELNLAAIELDSLRTSFTSSSYSSSSSINNEKYHGKRTFLVLHEYKNSSLLSTTNGTKIFSVKYGDRVRLLKRIGKSTLVVQKEDDGSIGFLPQSCLEYHQINSFLFFKDLRETVL